MNNADEVDFSSVYRLEQLGQNFPEEEVALIQNDMREATSYLESQNWCLEIQDVYYGIGVPKCFCAFLFHIRPSCPEIEEYLWVVTGDLPPLYLVTEAASTPAMALYAYTEVMKLWAESAVAQEFRDDLPPVAAPFTAENGALLQTRLAFIQDYLSEYHQDELDNETLQ